MALRVSRQAVDVLTKGAGTARIPRQNVEILAKGTGPLRITRQYVEILAEAGIGKASNAITVVSTADYTGPHSPFAVNDITIVSVANIITEYELAITDALTVAEVIGYSGTQRIDASNIIYIEDIGELDIKFRDPAQLLDIISTASYTYGPKSFGIIDTLTIVEEIIFTGPIYYPVTHALTITESVWRSGTLRASAESDLIETEEVFNEDTYELETVDIGFRDSASLEFIPTREPYAVLTVASVAGFELVKAGATPETETDTIVITDSAVLSLADTVLDPIVIVSTAAVTQGKVEINDVTIISTASLLKVSGEAGTDVLTINQSHSYELFRTQTLCTYSPFIGNTSSVDPLPPRPTAPTIVNYDNVQLSYPVNAPTDTVTLRGPELGNKNRLHNQRINRETRGGTLIVFADPIWPKMETIILDFYALSETECQDTLDFVSTSLGKLIKVRDWEGQVWIGIIVTAGPIIREVTNRLSLTIEIDSTLTWHTYAGFDWDAFIGAEWDGFLGE